mgnify:CR=1 FL=1
MTTGTVLARGGRCFPALSADLGLRGREDFQFRFGLFSRSGNVVQGNDGLFDDSSRCFNFGDFLHGSRCDRFSFDWGRLHGSGRLRGERVGVFAFRGDDLDGGGLITLFGRGTGGGSCVTVAFAAGQTGAAGGAERKVRRGFAARSGVGRRGWLGGRCAGRGCI